tara:strand:+ start:246 stop:689 length:444 start_codon:yes stop_codon:yes gene_type:complete
MYRLNKKVGVFMFVIVNKKNGSIHREPSKRSYARTEYKSAGAAKAGITRTIKFYNKAIADVKAVVKSGKSEFYSPYYNHFRDATDKALGRTHRADVNNYKVVPLAEYKEPMITRTGTCPGTGKKITVTEGINQPHYLSPLSESYWSM